MRSEIIFNSILSKYDKIYCIENRIVIRYNHREFQGRTNIISWYIVSKDSDRKNAPSEEKLNTTLNRI